MPSQQGKLVFVYTATGFDTVSSIASRFKIDQKQLRSVNPQWSNHAVLLLEEGDSVILPDQVDPLLLLKPNLKRCVCDQCGDPQDLDCPQDNPLITPERLTRLSARIVDGQLQASALEKARVTSSVNTKRRLSHFLGQSYVETVGFTTMVENLQYRTPAILRRNFSAIRGDADAADLIERGPEAIANRVYANRNGNGDENSGDGWTYRGSGYKQLTGRSNYREIGRLTGIPLEDSPELAREYDSGAMVAFAYWDARHCSVLADRNDVATITYRINGPAMLNLNERIQTTKRALKIWK